MANLTYKWQNLDKLDESVNGADVIGVISLDLISLTSLYHLSVVKRMFFLCIFTGLHCWNVTLKFGCVLY